MKKILITGQNSYIGNSFQQWVSNNSNSYKVDKVSVRNDDWKNLNFSEYDVIYHTAAIVHTSESNISIYNKVNRDLTIDLAKKAKAEGVKQFIFLSTMGVYGVETGIITKSTKPSPKTLYAKSKLDAENRLVDMNSENFKVAILRPPLVYGKDCPGNYQRLAKLALKLPVFPNIQNERSMIYIDNLSEFVRQLINQDINGVYFPQNKDYVSTTEMLTLIRSAHNKRTKRLKMLNPLIRLSMPFMKNVRKVYGDFIYSIEESNNLSIDLKKSIIVSEGGRENAR